MPPVVVSDMLPATLFSVPPLVATTAPTNPPLVSVPPASVTLLMTCENPPRESVPPPLIVVAELALNALAFPPTSMPPLTTVVPAKLFAPCNCQVLVPAFSNTPNPRYCAAGPSADTSKMLLAVPPSLNVSAVLAATTLPVTLEPACSSSVLVPPVKVMALARVTPSPLRPPCTVPLAENCQRQIAANDAGAARAIDALLSPGG